MSVRIVVVARHGSGRGPALPYEYRVPTRRSGPNRLTGPHVTRGETPAAVRQGPRPFPTPRSPPGPGRGRRPCPGAPPRAVPSAWARVGPGQHDPVGRLGAPALPVLQQHVHPHAALPLQASTPCGGRRAPRRHRRSPPCCSPSSAPDPPGCPSPRPPPARWTAPPPRPGHRGVGVDEEPQLPRPGPELLGPHQGPPGPVTRAAPISRYLGFRMLARWPGLSIQPRKAVLGGGVPPGQVLPHVVPAPAVRPVPRPPPPDRWGCVPSGLLWAK